VYDGTNLRLELQPKVLVRHRVLGLYDAGDLVVRTGGPSPEAIEWPNVLFLRSRLRRIEHMLHSREVVEERPGTAKHVSAGPGEVRRIVAGDPGPMTTHGEDSRDDATF
jgi:hypothetical protein